MRRLPREKETLGVGGRNYGWRRRKGRGRKKTRKERK
jgi:hypothetical protein